MRTKGLSSIVQCSFFFVKSQMNGGPFRFYSESTFVFLSMVEIIT